MNPYEVLGAPADADIETLRASYRQLVRLHHPDRAPDEAARRLANERMVAINYAWHIVNDPQRRAAYDARERAQKRDAARNEARHPAPDAAASAPSSPRERERREKELRQQRELELLEQQLRGSNRRPAPAGHSDRARKDQRRARRKSQRELNQLLQARLREKAADKSGGPRKKSGASVRRQMLEAMRLFWEEDRPGEAISICNHVLRVDNRNVAARELLGDFYLQLGRGDRALSLWEQALVLAPDNASIRRKLRALRPHDARSYKPQPRIPGRGTTAATQLYSHFNAPRLSLWGRVRLKLRRYLRGF